MRTRDLRRNPEEARLDEDRERSILNRHVLFPLPREWTF